MTFLRFLPLRRRAAALALVLAPVLSAAAALVTQKAGDDGASLLAAVGEEPGRWALGTGLTIVASGVLLAGLAHLASRLPHTARLAATGLVLSGIGALGHAAIAATELVLVPLSADDRTVAVQTVDRISESNELAVLFLMYLPGTLLGGLLLFTGLGVSKVVPTWAAALGGTGIAFGFFAEDAVPGGDLVTAAALSIAFATAVLAPSQPPPACAACATTRSPDRVALRP